jgi:hypothetical protein
MTKNTDKQTEAERAKVENQTNREKQKHEDKLADDTSPEQLRKDGGDVHPQKQVVPSQPNPADNPEYIGTRYDGNGGKGE